MERKAKMGLSDLSMMAIIYAVIGTIFLILGICLWRFSTDSESTLVGMIFAGIGLLFLVLGVIFLIVEIGKRNRANMLLSGGRYVWGEILEFVPNYSITVNNRHPYLAMVRYRSPDGEVHMFRSRNLLTYPDPSCVGKQVKVYYDGNSFKHYYVDLEGVLPKVTQH